MTKKELFEKYSINESHNVWENAIDNWMSVEVYRAMHGGKLPPNDDLTTGWIVNFLDEVHNSPEKHFGSENFGSLYVTSKRMVYRFSEQILEEINN